MFTALTEVDIYIPADSSSSMILDEDCLEVALELSKTLSTMVATSSSRGILDLDL